MRVSDLRHFLDIPDDAPAPARRLAEQLSLIVRAATAGDPGVPWVSAVPCVRRPGRRPCPGHIAVARSEVPTSIDWRCTDCGDDGTITGWESSPYDLRPGPGRAGAGPAQQIAVSGETAATLQSLMLLDAACERVIFRARRADHGVVLTGSADEFDELIDSVAAEANHEENRRRQKRLDAAFEELQGAAAAAEP